jgi:DNA helicase-2/ATP-dependent DNA helicase PcrA
MTETIAIGRERRVIGPPGCGKTHHLAEAVERAAKTYGGHNIVIASLTRASATVVASRVEIPRRQVGTLHSHGLHALGHDATKLAETGEGLRAWNDQAPIHWRLSGEAADVDDPLDWKGGAEPGDGLLSLYGNLRHQMTPRDEWPTEVRHFAEDWEAWKKAEERLDFTDMIEMALLHTDEAPGSPALLYVDEAQDCSRLELALIRHWGSRTQGTVVVGDPDQNLYEWRGSDPAAFFDPPIPDEHYRTLSQSYRVPRAVHEYAVRWIEQVDGRRQVLYHPRRVDPKDNASPVVEGAVRYLPTRCASPDEVFFADIEAQTQQGRKCMILATCSYMLDPVVKALRERALPFHNPYRVKAGRWNPLRQSTRDRLLAFLRPDPAVWGEAARFWSLDDVRTWARDLRAEFYRPRMKAVLAGVEGQERPSAARPEEILLYLTDAALGAAWALDPLWWGEAQTKAGRTPGLTYAIEIARAWGGKALTEEPLITVGTVHSVKGGEADVVYLFPDLSGKGLQDWEVNPAALRRVLYVAFTRAREELVICEPSTSRAVLLD